LSHLLPLVRTKALNPARPPITTHETPKQNYLLPSVTDLLFILLWFSLTFGILAPRLLGDAGTGWHIRDGQNILSTHRIPHTDPFSVTMNGQPWYAWEWLYDGLIGAVYNLMGLNGVVFVSALIIAATLALVFRLALAKGARLPIALLFFLLCAGASAIHLLARPHLLGWLITVVWFWILDSVARGASPSRLYSLPLLMLLWANLHGGFVTGLMLLGIFLVGEIVDFLLTKDVELRLRARKTSVNFAIVFLLSAAASLVNPYGFKLHSHVYSYLTNRFFMQHIDEFRSANLHGLPEQCFVMLLLLSVVVIVAARAKQASREWLLILFCGVSGLYAARNLPVAAMLLTMVAAPLFYRQPPTPDSSNERSTTFLSRLRAIGERTTDTELSLRGHVWPVVAVLVSLWVCLHQGTFLGRQVMHAEFSGKRFPVQAVDVLKQRGGREPIFTLDSWGGYLIYRFYPEPRVLVDDRHDLYGEAFVRDYLRILHVEPDWQSTLDTRNVNLILMPAKSKLSDALRTTPAWKLTYEDSVAAIFERRG
jgi:hypothetical protein